MATRTDPLTIAITQGNERLRSPYVYKYPADVGEERQPHSVIFHINARSNTRIQETQRNFGRQVSTAGQNRSQPGQGGAVLGAVGQIGGAALAAGAALNGLSGDANVLGKFLVGSLGVVGGFFAGDKIAQFIDEKVFEGTTSTIRLLASIQLHVSQPPSVSYGANWDENSLGALGAITNTPGITLTDMVNSKSGEYIARNIINAASLIPRELGLIGDIGASIEATTKKVNNPYKEQLFKSMGFRKFAFSYKFVPRNSSEYNSVKEIIKLFKLHMHPEKDDSKLFLHYPAEFDIVYHYRQSENSHINKISTCALTDMKVTYGGQDGFNTVKGTQGAPSEINMELAFTELEVLTNDRILRSGF